MDGKLKIGDKLVEGGKVYEVFEISKGKIGDNIERIIHYRPSFGNPINDSLVCSIPECNIEHPNKRYTMSKKEVNEILQYLAQKTKRFIELDIQEAKDTLLLNDLSKTARVLKKCYKEKEVKGVDFAKSKKDILSRAKDGIVEEIAIVHKVSLKYAEEKVMTALIGSL